MLDYVHVKRSLEEMRRHDKPLPCYCPPLNDWNVVKIRREPFKLGQGCSICGGTEC